MVKLNDFKTQLHPISLSKTSPDFPNSFDDAVTAPLDTIDILAITVASNLSCKVHIPEIVQSASKKLGVLFKCR